jgi:plastocyanin
MRKLLVLGVAVALLLAACGGDDDDSSSGSEGPPVSLSGTVNDKGTEKVSGSELELEADDNYFKPTFIEAEAGAKLTLTIKNEGAAQHTFTIDSAKIDEEIAPDDEVKVDVTVPDSGHLDFHCRFHGSAGMQGSIVAEKS